MPCIAIHLAIAKKYLEKHVENKDQFILGTLAPDLNIDNIGNYIKLDNYDKNSKHFGSNYKPSNLIEYLKGKTDLSLFLKDNDINTSFLRAYFLHLLCDCYFFDECILDSRLEGLSLEEGIKIGYNDYDLITEILINKYKLDIPELAKDIMSRKGTGKLQILNEEKIDEFINRMANLDLTSEKEKFL